MNICKISNYNHDIGTSLRWWLSGSFESNHILCCCWSLAVKLLCLCWRSAASERAKTCAMNLDRHSVMFYIPGTSISLGYACQWMRGTYFRLGACWRSGFQMPADAIHCQGPATCEQPSARRGAVPRPTWLTRLSDSEPHLQTRP